MRPTHVQPYPFKCPSPGHADLHTQAVAHLHQHQLPPPLGVLLQQPVQRQQLQLHALCKRYVGVGW